MKEAFGRTKDEIKRVQNSPSLDKEQNITLSPFSIGNNNENENVFRFPGERKSIFSVPQNKLAENGIHESDCKMHCF